MTMTTKNPTPSITPGANARSTGGDHRLMLLRDASASTSPGTGSPTAGSQASGVQKSGGLPFTDVRGWRVSTGGGDIVGSVTQLVVERDKQVVPRYLTVEIDPKLAKGKSTKAMSMLVPVGLAQLKTAEKQVHLELTTEAALERAVEGAVQVPAWDSEVALAKSYGVNGSPRTPAELYTQKLFNPVTLQAKTGAH